MKDSERYSFLTGQAIAGFSQWLEIFLIFSVPVFVLDATPKEMAVVPLAMALPSLMLGPAIGPVLDRGNLYALMLGGGVTRILTTALLMITTELSLFYFVVAIKSTGNSLYWGASSVLVNRTMGAPERTDYFTKISLLDQCTKIIAPFMGAFFLDDKSGFVLAFSVPLFVSCVSLMVVGFSIKPLDLAPAPKPRLSDYSYFGELKEGVRGIGFMPEKLKETVFIAVLCSASLAVYDPHLPVVFKSVDLDAYSYSFAVFGTAIGSILAAGLFKKFEKRYSVNNLSWIGVSCFYLSILMALLLLDSGSVDVYKILIVWVICGFGYELVALSSVINIQNLCPENMVGRISSLVRSVQLGAIVCLPSLGAYVISAWDSSRVFLISLAIGFVGILLYRKN